MNNCAAYVRTYKNLQLKMKCTSLVVIVVLLAFNIGLTTSVRYFLENFPKVKGIKPDFCGCASAQAVLNYYGFHSEPFYIGGV